MSKHQCETWQMLELAEDGWYCTVCGEPEVSDFDAARESYEAARIERDRIIDHPDKSVPLDEYKARIRMAQDAMQVAHGKMLGVRG